MAKATKTGDSAEAKTDEAPAATESKAPPATKELTAAAAAKRVSGRVRVPAMKDGKPVSDKGVFKMTERRLTAADVIGFAERDGKVTVVTVDGQKLHEAA